MHYSNFDSWFRLGDITNLKSFAKIVSDALPIDYYKIFCELEKTLVYELDFLHEAQATIKVAAAVAHSPDNKPVTAPLVVPLPISGLCSRNVIVMEFVDGVALSKLAKQMTAKGQFQVSSNIFGVVNGIFARMCNI